MSATNQFFILAGEPSADRLGGAIMKACQGNAEFFGMGGTDMIAEGINLLAPSNELTVFGPTQFLKAIPRVSRLANMLIDEIMDRRPDAIITIDSKAFSLRFAKRLKKRMAEQDWYAPIIHLVAPTVWCWGKWRAKPYATVMDKLLCLFPFEPPYFAPYSGNAEYVGHPLFEREVPDKKSARETLKFNSDEKILAMLPGSRNSEVKQLMPDMLEAYDILKSKYPDMKAIIPMSSHVAPKIQAYCANYPEIKLIKGDSQTMTALAAADAGIICSGTATLEAGMTGLPGVVIYKPDWFSMLIGWMLVDLDKIVLANVLTDTNIYPLLLWRKVRADALATEASKALDDPEKSQTISKAMQDVISTGSDHDFGQTTVNAIFSTIRDYKIKS